jgi:hypothetical protein
MDEEKSHKHGEWWLCKHKLCEVYAIFYRVQTPRQDGWALWLNENSIGVGHMYGPTELEPIEKIEVQFSPQKESIVPTVRW